MNFPRPRAPRRSTPTSPRSPVDVVIDVTTPDPVAQASKSSRYLPYRYDIAGAVRVGSQVPLRELEYFRAPWLGGGYDLEIRLGEVGVGVRRRTLLHRTA